MPNQHPDRSAGVRRLELVASALGERYANTRGFDFGPGKRGNVSMLSPYLRHRLLLEQEVLEFVLEQQDAGGAEKFVQEVFWRTYFKGWLEQHPTVWHDYRNSVSQHVQSLSDDPRLLERYTCAIDGATGIDCFDAWTDELKKNGYLHNHARMWFASIWVFTLRLPWQLGADFFYRHLLDGDPASNTLGWRWVSGLHTKGKTYLARAPGIETYTAGRFNPEGQLADTAPPLAESSLHPLKKLPLSQQLNSARRFGLLITEEDCSPESLRLAARPSAIIALTAPQDRSPLSVSSSADEFARGAVSDALQRAALHFQLPADQADGNDWANAILEWSDRHDLDTIATPYAPLGPVAERLKIAAEQLDKQGIRFVQIRRDYDSVCWPHAQKGFFRLKKQIPRLLDQIGVRSAETTTRKAG